MGNEYDLDAVLNLEQRLYDGGYKEGFAHGQIHGRIEGRELGRRTGFELWEELGFYEGFAKLWLVVSHPATKDDRSRIRSHAQSLLNLLDQFPRENPNPGDGDELDITKLRNQIRSRYRLLCVTVGTKPSFRARSDGPAPSEGAAESAQDTPAKQAVWRLKDSRGHIDEEQLF